MESIGILSSPFTHLDWKLRMHRQCLVFGLFVKVDNLGKPTIGLYVIDFPSVICPSMYTSRPQTLNGMYVWSKRSFLQSWRIRAFYPNLVCFTLLTRYVFVICISRPVSSGCQINNSWVHTYIQTASYQCYSHSSFS